MENIKQEFFVEGMHCAACELLIEKKLSKIEGIDKVDAKLPESKVYIQSSKNFDANELSKFVEAEGYKIVDKNTNPKVKTNEIASAAIIAAVVILIFLLIQKLGIVNIIGEGEITLPLIFMIGVVASLSTCMAVVGGLVLSLSSSYAQTGNKIRPMILFHVARLIGFFVLGGFIGLIGSAFTLSVSTTFILNIILFFVMLIMGINLLDIFPKAKNLQIKMPKFFGKNILKFENSQNPVAPILLGIATFVLPCGFTQSIQLESLRSGNWFQGAITMLVFALGTLPVLALISFASVKLSKTFQSGIFFKTSGFIIIFFAIFNFIAALVAVGLIRPVFNI